MMLFLDDSLFIQLDLYSYSKDTVSRGASNRFMQLKLLWWSDFVGNFYSYFKGPNEVLEKKFKLRILIFMILMSW